MVGQIYGKDGLRISLNAVEQFTEKIFRHHHRQHKVVEFILLMDISKEDIVVASIAKVRQKPEQIQESSEDIPDEDDLSEDFEEDMEELEEETLQKSESEE